MSDDRKPRRREQILQALAIMLEEDSGKRITTAALARQVGVSEAALYRHFPSKARMFEGLIDFIEESIFARITRILDDIPDATTRCGTILSLLLGFAEKNPGLARVLGGDVLTGETARCASGYTSSSSAWKPSSSRCCGKPSCAKGGAPASPPQQRPTCSSPRPKGVFRNTSAATSSGCLPSIGRISGRYSRASYLETLPNPHNEARALSTCTKQMKTPRRNDTGGAFSCVRRECYAAMAASPIFWRSFFMAFFSSWRMRSALTPYTSAKSCNVALSSVSQRRCKMSRERSSNALSAS